MKSTTVETPKLGEHKLIHMVSKDEPLYQHGMRQEYPDLNNYLEAKGWNRTQPEWYEHPEFPNNNAITFNGELQFLYWGETPEEKADIEEFGAVLVTYEQLGKKP